MVNFTFPLTFFFNTSITCLITKYRNFQTLLYFMKKKFFDKTYYSSASIFLSLLKLKFIFLFIGFIDNLKICPKILIVSVFYGKFNVKAKIFFQFPIGFFQWIFNEILCRKTTYTQDVLIPTNNLLVVKYFQY